MDKLTENHVAQNADHDDNLQKNENLAQLVDGHIAENAGQNPNKGRNEQNWKGNVPFVQVEYRLENLGFTVMQLKKQRILAL